MSQATLFERRRKRPFTSMVAKLWERYGTTEAGRRAFKQMYLEHGLPGRKADRAMAARLAETRPELAGLTWRVVQDFRLKLGPGWGGGTHPHRGSKRGRAKFRGKVLALSPADVEREIRRWNEATHHPDHLDCCGIGPGGVEGRTGYEALEPNEPPADPKPLVPSPKTPELAARFLELMFQNGQVGSDLDPDRLTPEEAAEIAKRAAKALEHA